MIMNPAYEKLLKCYDSYKAKIDFTPKVALILGSGLGDYADDIRVVDTLDYHDIEGFPVSTVPGHKGRFIFGYVDDVPVVCMHAGDFMLIKDQIASFVPSPLRGANIEELGVRFPDMSQIYDLDLQDIVKCAASALEIRIKEGTYIQLSGPQFETPHEVAMCRTLGADAVGMSTACEAIAAKHMGMKVLGISCISNLASGISSIPLSHAEVQETADAVAPKFKALVTETIKAIGAQQN